MIASLLATLPLLASLHVPDATASEPKQNWPCFQGPNRSGVVPYSNWSPVGQPEPLWTLEVGRGYSCPSIFDGYLVTLGHSVEDQEDVVVCHDAETGDELWWMAFPAKDAPRYHTGGTLTTPAIHDGVVYTSNRAGIVHALDVTDGTVLWKRDYRGELALEGSFHGYCASPVVLEDRIVFVFAGTVVVVQREGGDVLWKSEDGGDGAYTNPSVFELGGNTVAAAMLGQRLFVFDVADGTVRHQVDWPLVGNSVHVAAPTPVPGDRLFVSTAYNKGGGLLQLGQDSLEPELLWFTRRMRNKVTGVFLYEDHLYGFDESMLKCIDLEGKERWRVRGLGMGALSIVGGRLVVLSSSGELIIAEATPDEFRELSRQQVLEGGVYWTMPVVANGLIYVRNSEGQLACFDHRAPSTEGEASQEQANRRELPTPEELFEGHRSWARVTEASSQGQAATPGQVQEGRGLRLEGTWEITGRGMAHTPASLLLAGPDRWRLALDDDGLVQAYDGVRGWTLDPRGNRMYTDQELEELPFLFPLGDLLVPSPTAEELQGAVTKGQPATGKPRSWMVQVPRTLAGKVRQVSYTFDAATGRLIAREVEGSSAFEFGEEVLVDGWRLPGRVTIYRKGDGQEEQLLFQRATWVDLGAEPFPVPASLGHLVLSPEELEALEQELRQRFQAELGRYQVNIPFIPTDEMNFVVKGGRAMIVMKGQGEGRPIVPEDVHEGRYLIEGPRDTRLGFQRDAAGKVTAAELLFPGPDGKEQVFVLPRWKEESK